MYTRIPTQARGTHPGPGASGLEVEAVRTMLVCLLLLGLVIGARADYEVPQILTVNGLSLSYRRTEIQQKLGPPVASRPLKASRFGEFFEYTYRGGLRAAFANQRADSFPVLLVGRQAASRGHALAGGLTPAQVRDALGEPTSHEAGADCEEWVYADQERRTQLLVFFRDGKVTEYCVARMRTDSTFR